MTGRKQSQKLDVDEMRTDSKRPGQGPGSQADDFAAAAGCVADEWEAQSGQSGPSCSTVQDGQGGRAVQDGQDGQDGQAEPEVPQPDDWAEPLSPLEQAQAEAEEYRDRFIRLQAEWDNFRKRTAAEREQERLRATANLVERLLPIIDDLERAIEHSDSASEASLKEGIAAVHSKLAEALQRDGLKAIDPIGEAFDANLHQAVGKEEDSSVPDETVTQVYQKGYQMGDRVLRSAMVVVSHGGPARECPELPDAE